MAKALLGYVGGSDPRLLAEMRRLQQRVQDLESELVRIQTENDALSSAAAQHPGDSMLDRIDIDVPQEPALT
jgi:predicted lipase